MSAQSTLLVHVFTAIFMTGLIWTIQWVHYPSFHFADSTRFTDFEHFHASRISYIVLPVMVVELITAFLLVAQMPEHRILFIVNLAVLGSIWLITLLVSARLHGLLGQGYDVDIVNRLVSTNWFRTILWSGRSLALCFFLPRLLLT